MLDNFMNSSNNSSDTKTLIKAKQTYISSNNIFNLRKRKKDFNEERNLLRYQSKKH